MSRGYQLPNLVFYQSTLYSSKKDAYSYCELVRFLYELEGKKLFYFPWLQKLINGFYFK